MAWRVMSTKPAAVSGRAPDKALAASVIGGNPRVVDITRSVAPFIPLAEAAL